MGSAKLRKKRDKYYARFYDGNKQPNRKTIALYTTRKSVAQKKLRRMEEGWAEGTFDPWAGGWLKGTRLLSDAAQEFLDAKEAAGLRPNTIEAYTYVLEGLQEHAGSEITVRQVAPSSVRQYVHAPKVVAGEAEPVSNATKRHRHSHLSTFFRWAIDQGWADENPVEEVTKPRKEESKKAFLSPEGVEKVLSAIDGHREVRKNEPGPTPNNAWLKEIIVVAVGTGLRRGELLNLQWRDVDLDGGRVYVRNRDGFRAKNGQERAVPLVGEAHEMLSAMKESQRAIPNDPVFTDENGNVPRPDRVTKRFKFYVRRAKLQDREDLHFHSLRHTTASWLTMEGVPKQVIAEVLGHTSTRMTERYSHLAPDAVEEGMKKVFGE